MWKTSVLLDKVQPEDDEELRCEVLLLFWGEAQPQFIGTIAKHKSTDSDSASDTDTDEWWASPVGKIEGLEYWYPGLKSSEEAVTLLIALREIA